MVHAHAAVFERELVWDAMPPMEQALYGTTLAIYGIDVRRGLSAADAVLAKFRILSDRRARLPEPEYEVALTNLDFKFEEFVVWYSVEYRIRGGHESDRPSPEVILEAYRQYALNRRATTMHGGDQS